MFTEPVFVMYTSTTFHAFSAICTVLLENPIIYDTWYSVGIDPNALIHLICVVKKNTWNLVLKWRGQEIDASGVDGSVSISK